MFAFHMNFIRGHISPEISPIKWPFKDKMVTTQSQDSSNVISHVHSGSGREGYNRYLWEVLLDYTKFL